MTPTPFVPGDDPDQNTPDGVTEGEAPDLPGDDE